ncbi:MAG: hypothetical protein ACXAE3_08265 [Candidatus Kariarchaeaceae archaeon]
MSKFNILDEEVLERAAAIFRSHEKYNEMTLETLKRAVEKGWLTRQYFSRGKHDLVLPAWVQGVIGPDGEANHGIAGSMELVNTDLRSYYALGSPRSEEEPVVDHRGGIIPKPNSYTIIFGTIINGRPYYSSEVGEVSVDYEEGYPACTVYWKVDGDNLVYDVFADRDEDGNEALGINVVRGLANHPLLVTLSPLDADGITRVDNIAYNNKEMVVSFNDDLPEIKINMEPIRVTALPINQGHAGRLVIESTGDSEKVHCPAGLASWAAQFPVRANPLFVVKLDGDEIPDDFPDFDDVQWAWEDIVDEYLPEISTSDDEADYFFKASAIVLRLLLDESSGEVTVGPSVQERQWLPALVHQTRALDRLGFHTEVTKVLDKLYSEIDSNGVIDHNQQFSAQGAMIMALVNHYYISLDTGFIGDKYSGMKRIAEWVTRTRKRSEEDSDSPSEIVGLLPPGNASWFNPLYWKLDYYYTHNFWSASVLDLMTSLSKNLGKHSDAEKFENDLEKYRQSIDDSITTISDDLSYLPAGPYQRDGAEMIFNLHAFYPLKLYQPAFQLLKNTTDWLWDNYTHNGGILIDQPWNAYGSYFSMLMAQSYRYLGENDKVTKIMKFLLDNVTNRSGWAEGISPLTRLGSVGDSPNGYAAAEFVNLILDFFAEDQISGVPIFLRGIPIEWLRNGVEAKNLRLFHSGTLDISAELEGDTLSVEWDYKNPNPEIKPILHLPCPAKSLPDGVEQISTRELRLLESNGSVEIKLQPIKGE